MKNHPVADWLKREGRKANWLAARLGITPQYLCALTSGTRQPSIELAARVEEATGGAVKAAKLRPCCTRCGQALPRD